MLTLRPSTGRQLALQHGCRSRAYTDVFTARHQGKRASDDRTKPPYLFCFLANKKEWGAQVWKRALIWAGCLLLRGLLRFTQVRLGF